MFGKEREGIQYAKKTLGLPLNKNPESAQDLKMIRTVRDDLAKKYHPDRLHNKTREEKTAGLEKTMKVNESFKILSDEFKSRMQFLKDN